MATRSNHRARRSERTRLLNERIERVDASLDKKLKGAAKKTSGEQPASSKPAGSSTQ